MFGFGSVSIVEDIVARVRLSEFDEAGQGLVEYALITAVISIAAVVVLTMIGGYLPHLYAIPLNAL